ncbi:dTDP-4-dehydrorhamnose 3,5-epimerase family protein [Bosea sp. MMO-172]|uniref:dTDP-4-dehydrorhamnose 3,5-epimerase family protein n=1 Tax=Bosea sp. MMO-172 TaxID=3127885 RepID=UPI0030187F53
MSRFVVTDLPLRGLKLLERKRMSDERGFLSRLFCAEELAAAGWRKPAAQINHTCTVQQGAVRGMHFQLPPYAEMKLVTCLKGEVWDVAVDLRAGSPSFLQWHAERLSAQNNRALLIPEGFAHGFQVLSDGAELLYCHSVPYTPEAEAGLNPQDRRLDIGWPLPVADMSERDATRSFLEPSYAGVIL